MPRERWRLPTLQLGAVESVAADRWFRREAEVVTRAPTRRPCERMIEIVRYTQRNAKRWRDGDMRKCWTAAGKLVAEQQFLRVIGYRDLATLVIAVERHALGLLPEEHRTTGGPRAGYRLIVNPGSPRKLHDEWDNLGARFGSSQSRSRVRGRPASDPHPT